MSGRRRRHDGWDGGSQDAQDNRRDPWADSSIDDWGGREAAQPDDASWPAAPVADAGSDRGRPDQGADASRAERGHGAASGYANGDGPAGAKAYTPSFSSFQLGRGEERGEAGGQPGGYRPAGPADGRGGGPGDTRSGGYGDERGSGYRAPGARPGSARDDAGYGAGQRDASGYGGGRGEAGGGYPDPGYPRTASYGRGEAGPGRREPSAFEPARGGAGGYGQPAHGQPGYGHGGGSDYDPPGYQNGRPGAALQLPEFTPAEGDDADDDGSTGTPRPIGRLSIYTLHEDKAKEFDVLAERAAEGVRTAEPDTLVFVIHVVPKAPLQRIMYEIYRNRAAFLSHERQPHIRQFAADRASCVLATNVIDLRLKYAKVAALGGAPGLSAAPDERSRRPADPAAAGGRSGASGSDRAPQFVSAQPQGPEFSPAPQYSGTEPPTVGRPAAQAQDRPRQVSAFPDLVPSEGQQPRDRQAAAQAASAQPAASFTPARGRHPGAGRQHAATGREDYPSIAAYDNAANGGDRGGNSQYGMPAGYSPTARYANGGSYPSANGYQGSNGYSGEGGYQGANDYSGGNSYRGGNGYSGGNGYRGTNDYPDTNGYPGGGGYRGGGSYSSGSSGSSGSGGDFTDDAGQGYAAVGGYPDTGARTYGAQYTPRYRELTSGPSPALKRGGKQDDGGRHGDEDRGSSRSSDRDQRKPDQRLASARDAHHAAVPPGVPSVR